MATTKKKTTKEKAEPKKEKSKRFNTPEAMQDKWKEYKEYCDSQTVTRTEFSQKNSEFVSATIPAPITYTIKGFCIWLGMTETNFYLTYNDNDRFKSVIAHMKEECEMDARRKFENNTINSRLAGLWMSNYGYTTNVNEKVEADMDLNISVDYGDDE